MNDWKNVISEIAFETAYLSNHRTVYMRGESSPANLGLCNSQQDLRDSHISKFS